MEIITSYCPDAICNQIEMYMSVKSDNIYTWLNLSHQIHRENDLPAVINTNGDQMWYVNGKKHRLHDRPAIILEGQSGFGRYKKNTRKWYINDLCHRDDDLPAIIWGDGTQEWYKKGKLHRDNDLPARVRRSCSFWYVNGIIHRDNGKPAVMQCNGINIWYVHGKVFTDMESIEYNNG